MTKFILPLLLISSLSFAQKKYVMVIHGGAGTITKANLSPEKEKEYREKLTEALQKGYAEIKNGKTSLDAVTAAIMVMEDSPLFNAGKGAVLTNEGKNELDASIMDGSNLKAGAVAGVTTIKNPILAARAVMDKSEHVMMAGPGAERFAKEQKLTIVDPKYFWTEKAAKALEKAKAMESQKKTSELTKDKLPTYFLVDHKFGTVGAVALDHNGHIAAGTSTGGMTNKKYGRVGDSPIIGAGTYANEQVGISGTGWGEFFIRTVASKTAADRMKFLNKSVADATQASIDDIGQLGGNGGLIALDKDGNVAMPFNTEGMYRGTVTDKGEIEVFIYKN